MCNPCQVFCWKMCYWTCAINQVFTYEDHLFCLQSSNKLLVLASGLHFGTLQPVFPCLLNTPRDKTHKCGPQFMERWGSYLQAHEPKREPREPQYSSGQDSVVQNHAPRNRQRDRETHWWLVSAHSQDMRDLTPHMQCVLTRTSKIWTWPLQVSRLSTSVISKRERLFKRCFLSLEILEHWRDATGWR